MAGTTSSPPSSDPNVNGTSSPWGDEDAQAGEDQIIGDLLRGYANEEPTRPNCRDNFYRNAHSAGTGSGQRAPRSGGGKEPCVVQTLRGRRPNDFMGISQSWGASTSRPLGPATTTAAPILAAWSWTGGCEHLNPGRAMHFPATAATGESAAHAEDTGRSPG